MYYELASLFCHFLFNPYFWFADTRVGWVRQVSEVWNAILLECTQHVDTKDGRSTAGILILHLLHSLQSELPSLNHILCIVNIITEIRAYIHRIFSCYFCSTFLMLDEIFSRLMLVGQCVGSQPVENCPAVSITKRSFMDNPPVLEQLLKIGRLNKNWEL